MLSSIDTLEIAKRLRDAGIEEKQAEAITGALRDTRDAGLAHLATKEDVALLRQDITALELRLTIRLGGMIAAGVAVLAAIKFFG